MAVRAIVFDLYGVLGLNNWQEFKQAHFGSRPEDWEQLRALGQRVDAGKATDIELVQAVANETGETIMTVRDQFERTVPNEPMLDYIAASLHGHYKLGLLSNASSDVLGDIFSPKEVAMFDQITTSYHVGLTKPDPRIFLLLTNRLGIEPEQCLFIDDKETNVAAAQELGFQTIQYETVSQTKQAIEEIVAR